MSTVDPGGEARTPRRRNPRAPLALAATLTGGALVCVAVVLIILGGRKETIPRLLFSKGSPEYDTILDLARRLAGDSTVMDPDADPEVAAGGCVRLRNVLRTTLDSIEVGCCGIYEIPLGLSPQGGPEPDWPGVLLIFDPPAALTTRTTVDPWTSEYAVLPWKEMRLEDIVRVYFPALVTGRPTPTDLVQDGAYFLCERAVKRACAPEWMTGAWWGLNHQRRLGFALEEVGRELGGW